MPQLKFIFFYALVVVIHRIFFLSYCYQYLDANIGLKLLLSDSVLGPDYPASGKDPASMFCLVYLYLEKRR